MGHRAPLCRLGRPRRDSGLIWDVLRRRASSAWLMDADTPRARVFGMLKLERGMDAEAIATLCDGGRFAPEPLTEANARR